MAVTIKDVPNGTEIQIGTSPSKYYSAYADLSLQSVSKNVPLDATIGGSRINEYYTIVTRQGKELFLPNHFTDFVFVDLSLNTYIPTTKEELYLYSSFTTHLTRNTSPTINILTGSGLSDPMPNGTQSIFNITVAGVTVDNLVSINVTNANTFPTNVFVASTSLIANDTVQVVLENQSGSLVPALPVDIQIITT